MKQETPPASMYFVALVCPPPINKVVTRFKKYMKDHFQCVVAMRSHAHLTLVKPFWIEANWEEYLLGTLEACDVSIKPFDIELHGFSHFGKRVMYVDIKQSEQLNELKKRVEDHFIKTFGDSLRKEQLSFQPHITIANRDLKPGDFDKAWEHFKKVKYEATFRAEKISLLKLVDGKWIVFREKQLPN